MTTTSSTIHRSPEAGTQPDRTPARRSTLRAVAVPTEHGGWSLTIEPVVLGLAMAWSAAGLALGIAAVVAFVLRSPLRVLLVDTYRRRWLPRTRTAAIVALVETALLVLLVGLATFAAEEPFWPPLLAAVPLVGLELAYDARSRSRRLVPELAGTVGIGAVAAAVGLAGGLDLGTALGLWLAAAARAVASVTYVRTQILRAHDRPHRRWHSDLAQAVGVLAAAAAALGGALPAATAVALALMASTNAIGVRRSPSRPVVIGVQQMAWGLLVIVATAVPLAS